MQNEFLFLVFQHILSDPSSCMPLIFSSIKYLPQLVVKNTAYIYYISSYNGKYNIQITIHGSSPNIFETIRCTVASHPTRLSKAFHVILGTSIFFIIIIVVTAHSLSGNHQHSVPARTLDFYLPRFYLGSHTWPRNHVIFRNYGKINFPHRFFCFFNANLVQWHNPWLNSLVRSKATV